MYEENLTSKISKLIISSDPLINGTAIENAKIAFIDYLAVTFAVSNYNNIEVFNNILKESKDKNSIKVIGKGFKTDSLNSALYNGFLGHYLDFDDVHEESRSHPSVVIFPALLSLSLHRKYTFYEFLSAYVVGVETMVKLTKALGDNHYNKGWHNTSTIGVIAASAASSYLLKSSKDQVATALGIAATTASGLRLQFGTEVKPLHAGLSSRSGVFAAQISLNNIKGSREVFDSQNNYLDVYSDFPMREKLIESWGEPWAITSPGLWFKKYPCCSASYHAIDAIKSILKKAIVKIDDIEFIEVIYPPGGDEALIYKTPQTPQQGKFSVEYIIAKCLVDGDVTINTFNGNSIDGEIGSLMSKIRRVYDPTIKPEKDAIPQKRFTIIKLKLKDKMLESRVDYPLGSSKKPLTKGEVIQKFELISKNKDLLLKEILDSNEMTLLQSIYNKI